MSASARLVGSVGALCQTVIMSGFTRDTLHYGDRLVYEALLGKWDRYHVQCGCRQDWILAHAEPAGFRVARRGSGFVALVGPSLTEGVNENKLTTNALWQAVTGTPGAQDWFDQVRVVPRPESAESAMPEAARKAANKERFAERNARAATAGLEPPTEAQLRYLSSLAATVSRERFDDLFAMAVKGSKVPARGPDEKTQQVVERLTKAVARKMISALSGRR